jgi:hypothetical protein
MKLARLIGALMLPILLAGCFLTPGAFNASVDVRKDGSFTFAYKGEMIFQSPNDLVGTASAPKIWSERNAKCSKDKGSDPFYDEYAERTSEPEQKVTATPSSSAQQMDPETQAKAEATILAAIEAVDEMEPLGARPCTKAELAKLKKAFDETQAAKRAKDKIESDQFAALFGFNPGDEAANQKIAANMMKYDGWKSVTYRGKGVFDVDYQLTSKAGHDFLFPLLPQGDFIIPFVALRKREGGTIGVNAPALVGGGIKALASRGQALGRMAGGKDLQGMGSLTKGTFTLTTDGEILTNNTEDGPAKDANGRKLVWEIGPQTEKIPEALIRLK